MEANGRSFAVVTGASSGIGLELARRCAENGFDLLIAADDPKLEDAADELRALGAQVETVLADLGSPGGVSDLIEAVGSRQVDALIANAGHGLGGAFLDQDLAEIQHVIDTNVSGTLHLLHELGRGMRDRGQGRILITGSVAGYIPGTFTAVYNGTKAFVDNFALAFRNELKDTGVTVTLLMPGPTETEFFERAGMMDTKVAQDEKMDADEVARIGFDAMMDGEADVVAGLKNKAEVAMANVTPNTVLAERHRKLAEPGTGRD
jgi:short-subunit dehydrogenase